MHGLDTVPLAVTKEYLADDDRCKGKAQTTDYHRCTAIGWGILLTLKDLWDDIAKKYMPLNPPPLFSMRECYRLHAQSTGGASRKTFLEIFPWYVYIVYQFNGTIPTIPNTIFIVKVLNL
jgi:hypothetical protein